MSYVYLIPSKDGTKFKCGYTSNIYRRFREIGLNKFNYGNWCVVETKFDSQKLERNLHGNFDKAKIEIPFCDGYTEWFDRSVFSDFLQLIKKYIEAHEYEIVEFYWCFCDDKSLEGIRSHLKNFREESLPLLNIC